MDYVKKDAAIRAALKSANEKGQLSVVAAVTGLPKSKLEVIMNGTKPLDMVHRSMLIIHLA